MPKAKPYSGAVDEKLAVQLLNSTGTVVDEKLLGDALVAAREHLAQLVEHATEALEDNELAAILAEHLATKMGRRGRSQIYVEESGTVMLDISYEEQQPKRRSRAPRSSSVPLMEELKARAKKLGVDISSYGIKRKKIHEYLTKVEAGEITPTPKKKSSKKPKPEIKTANDPPEEDPGPMSAGPDETKVTPPPDDPKPPPKRGFVKTSEAVTSPVVVEMPPPEGDSNGAKSAKKPSEGPKGRSMRELVKDAQELSIADLLSSEPPK